MVRRPAYLIVTCAPVTVAQDARAIAALRCGSWGHFTQPAWVEFLEGLSHFGDEAQTLLAVGELLVGDHHLDARPLGLAVAGYPADPGAQGPQNA